MICLESVFSTERVGRSVSKWRQDLVLSCRFPSLRLEATTAFATKFAQSILGCANWETFVADTKCF